MNEMSKRISDHDIERLLAGQTPEGRPELAHVAASLAEFRAVAHEAVPQPSADEVNNFVSSNPVMFDQRKTFVVDQIVVPRADQALRVTVLMHKPVGFVSGQAEDGHEPASVLFVPENQWMGDKSGQTFNRNHLRGLAPAGRLDIDSHGLLVLTQDGRVARVLIGEDSTIEKEYLVRVRATKSFGNGPLSEVFPAESLALLNHGLELDDQPLKPAKVSWQNEEQMRFVLREGKKRQIRRMCEAVGLEVVALKRVRIGRIPLADLPVGKWRYLRNDEAF